ncbi:hypothetical protein NLG97_g10919 [Lecanicillium saksenae]|uniref:Uncharacterized protein n=1 Tax=Lecanicillium saksenae TaxID=468837 RepID=A0ACC1QC08_9HYPO|nr:hypothetical protein NLG97_g10919 [Lecanicillium saksenae]
MTMAYHSPPSRSVTGQRLACEECRRRKLRCDGSQPRCSTCESADTECNVNTDRVSRGPKKGYLKALQSKIDILESRLRARENEYPWAPDDQGSGTERPSAITSLPSAPGGVGTGTTESDSSHHFATATPFMLEQEPYLSAFADFSAVPANTMLMPVLAPLTPATEISSRSGILASDVVHDEL